jgi:hypothetical protein
MLMAGGVAALLIYCAVVNKTPAQVIRDTLQNGTAAKPPAEAGAVNGTAVKDANNPQNMSNKYKGGPTTYIPLSGAY